jgi:hypothetical protein
VDESGHSGDSGPSSGGAGGETRDRTPMNGWAVSDSPWSHAGAALDPEDEDLPAWRRPSGEIRPFARQPLPAEPSSDPFGPLTGSGFGTSSEVETASPLARPDSAGRGWSSGRYADLLPHPSSNAAPALAQPDEPPPLPSPLESPRPDPLLPGGLRPAIQRPDTLDTADEQRALAAHGIDAPTPSSAPPYPYEGDLDDARREASRPPGAPHRGSVPLARMFPAVRPAAPGGRRVDWIGAESARHSIEPGAAVDSGDGDGEEPLTGETSAARAAYDPATFPRRLPYEPTSPAAPEPDPEPPAAFPEPPVAYPEPLTPYPGALPGETVSGALPQRVPAEPDVPTVPEPPSVEPPAETPALARIATHLRRGDVLPAGERPEGFDVRAILAAVQEVDGVREASLRTTHQGAHSLRLDLAEGADPAEVSRHVARLLQDRMGLDAAVQGPPTPPATGSAAVPFVPTQAVPTGRASVVPPTRPRVEELPDVRSAAPAAPVSLPAAPVSAPPAPASPAARTYVAGPSTTAGTTDSALSDADCGPPQPLAVGDRPGPRVVLENVQVNTFGTEATVEVRLGAGGQVAAGTATGPAVDGYLLRLCATATAHAVDELLSDADHSAGPARCFVEHAASVSFGPLQVAVVVLLLSCGTWVEQLAGSAVVTGDDRHAVVRATLAAVNRRLEALLS